MAIEILYFQSFLESKETTETFDTIEGEIFNLETNDGCDLNLSKELLGIFKEYEKYQKKTENGIHGKTVRYWFGYIKMVQLYHQFIRSIRTGALELYIFCLKRLSNFFTFNHPNYARWLVRYHDNLLKLKSTHPQIHEEFLKGCFSLKKTTKSFSRLPIDLTLEQTINADAAWERKGILVLTKFNICKAKMGSKSFHSHKDHFTVVRRS